MPNSPTLSEVHVNRPLTNLMQVYMQKQDAFIADRVFPNVPCLKKSDRFFTIPKGQWFKAGAAPRAPGSETVGINYHVDSSPTYVCDTYGVHMDLDDQTRANYDTPLAADESAMRLVARNLLLTRELQFVKTFLQPGIWSGVSATGSTTVTDYDVKGHGYGYWNDDTSNPMRDVADCCAIIESRTGIRPNKMTLGVKAYDALRNNQMIINLIRYTQRGVVTKDLLASLFELDEINISRAVLNSSPAGIADNLGFIFDGGALLTYSPAAPSIQDASAGYNFAWTGYLGANAYGSVMTNYRMPWLRSDRIEGEMSYDMKMVASDLGVYMTNLINPDASDSQSNGAVATQPSAPSGQPATSPTSGS